MAGSLSVFPPLSLACSQTAWGHDGGPIGAGMLGCGLLGLSQMQHLWQFYLLYGLLIGGAVGAFNVPLTAMVTRWFVTHRGLTVALANCGIGVGGMLFAPLSRWLIMSFDWRATFFVYGLLVWAVVLPLSLLIRERPQDIGLLPYNTAPAQTAETSIPAAVPYTFTQVLAMPVFWVIALVHFFCCAAHSGPIFHMVSALIDAGSDKLAAATVFACRVLPVCLVALAQACWRTALAVKIFS